LVGERNTIHIAAFQYKTAHGLNFFLFSLESSALALNSALVKLDCLRWVLACPPNEKPAIVDKKIEEVAVVVGDIAPELSSDNAVP
jgi:hypothetical protein